MREERLYSAKEFIKKLLGKKEEDTSSKGQARLRWKLPSRDQRGKERERFYTKL